MDSLEELMDYKAQIKKIPMSGTFELLPKCNMNCKMCYVVHQHSEKYLDIDFWYNAIKQAYENGMLFALLTGGEPFLYPDFMDLYEKVRSLPIYVSINTNGTLLNEEIIKRIAKNAPRKMNISLYGASNETYANLCGNPKGFTQVMNTMNLLKKYNILFEVHTVLTPENIHDYDEIVNICNELRVHLKMSYYMFPPFRKEGQLTERFSRFTPQEAARISFKYKKDASIYKEDEFNEYVKGVLDKYNNPELFEHYGHNCMTCKAGLSAFWVDYRGNVSNCGMMNQGKLNLKNTSFKEIWENIKEDTASTRISEKCAVCRMRSFCPICTAGAFCETGSTTGVAQYGCDYCEEYIKLVKEYLGEE